MLLGYCFAPFCSKQTVQHSTTFPQRDIVYIAAYFTLKPLYSSTLIVCCQLCQLPTPQAFMQPNTIRHAGFYKLITSWKVPLLFSLQDTGCMLSKRNFKEFCLSSFSMSFGPEKMVAFLDSVHIWLLLCMFLLFQSFVAHVPAF